MSKDSRIMSQFLAVICANIMSISFGTFIGWPSASFLELQAEDSSLEMGPMTNTEAGLVAATLSLGAFFGTILFTLLADRIGRKRCLMLLTIPNFIGWIVNYYAQNPIQLCISRFFAGFVGSILAIIPIYVAEISEARVRGILGSILVPALDLGVLIAFICGHFVSYANTAVICIPLPLIFLLTFHEVPETPQYFLKRNNLEDAEKSLRFYRNKSNIREELSKEHLAELQQFQIQESKVKTHASWQDFKNRTSRKVLLIGIVLVLLSQWSGSSILLNYSGKVFGQSGSSLSPTLSAIIMGVIQFLGSCVFAALVEHAGRKRLLTISAIGAGIGHVFLGVHSYLLVLGYDMSSFHWLPITSFSFIIFIDCVGVATFSLIAEIMPPKIRNIGSMLCISVYWITGFTSIMVFPMLSEAVGLHVTLFFFAGCCFMGVVFIIIFVPETKGKTLKEVLLML